MLRRNLTVAFAVSALLLLGWEDPTPDSTLVVDAFQAFADIVEALGDRRRDAAPPSFPFVRNLALPLSQFSSAGPSGTAKRRR